MKPLTDAQIRVLEEAAKGDVWRDTCGYVTRRGEQQYVIVECRNLGHLRDAPSRGRRREAIELTPSGHAALQEARG